MNEAEIIQKAGKRLRVFPTLDALHKQFAMDIAQEIETNNRLNRSSKFILPVGPVGQYEFLIDIIKTNCLSLESCYFFFMDEYCDESGKVVPESHPLSFKGIVQRLFLSKIPESARLNPHHVYFPSEKNIDSLPSIIDSLGGIDVCFGGIGIHGHIAFNEPEPGVSMMKARKVRLNDFTVTINAIRANVGGNLECFPREAYTIGMKEILSAKKIMLYCRNGTPYDWANTILRVALFGEPGDDYPVTHIRKKEYIITTDEFTLQSPKFLL